MKKRNKPLKSVLIRLVSDNCSVGSSIIIMNTVIHIILIITLS